MANGCVRKATAPNVIARLKIRNEGAFLFRISAGREASALADQALVSGTNFLTFALLARALGVSEFGVFALSWSVVLLVSSLQMALIVAPMMSIGPKQDPTVSSVYYGAVTTQELCFVFLSFLCVYAGTHVFAFCFPFWKTHQLALPLAGATAAYLAQDYGRRYFFTISRNGLALATDALSYLTQLPLLWWMVTRHQLTSTQGALDHSAYLVRWRFGECVLACGPPLRLRDDANSCCSPLESLQMAGPVCCPTVEFA